MLSQATHHNHQAQDKSEKSDAGKANSRSNWADKNSSKSSISVVSVKHGLSECSSTKSRVINDVHYPKTAGTRAPFHDKAHQVLPNLDQVAVIINTESSRQLPVNKESNYKSTFVKKGFFQHTSAKKEQEHPVKITAPDVTPPGNPRFPWKAYRKLFEISN